MMPLGFYDDETEETEDLTISLMSMVYGTQYYDSGNIVDIILANQKRYYLVVNRTEPNQTIIYMFDDEAWVSMNGSVITFSAGYQYAKTIIGNNGGIWFPSMSIFTGVPSEGNVNILDMVSAGSFRYTVYTNTEITYQGVRFPQYAELKEVQTSDTTQTFIMLVLAFVFLLYVFKSLFSKWRTY